MSLLQEFLNSNPVDNLTDEVIISDRFKDKDGKFLKFKIKAMSGPEFENYRKKAMVINTKGKRTVELNLQELNSQIIINHTFEPNFKDASSIQKLGCVTPVDYLNKVLLPGEIAELSNKIQQLSGFNKDMSELVEEAKN